MLATMFCALCAWTTMIFFVWVVWFNFKKGTNHIKRLHQVPCTACEYFTNDFRLKCTVHPIKACSEEAIGCIDFEPKTHNCNACHKFRHKLN
jgi:hypothetical protein